MIVADAKTLIDTYARWIDRSAIAVSIGILGEVAWDIFRERPNWKDWKIFIPFVFGVLVLAGVVGEWVFGSKLSVLSRAIQQQSDEKVANLQAQVADANAKVAQANKDAKQAQLATEILNAQSAQLSNRQTGDEVRVARIGKSIEPWKLQLSDREIEGFIPYKGKVVLLLTESVNPDGLFVAEKIYSQLSPLLAFDRVVNNGVYLNPKWNVGVHIYYDDTSEGLAEQFRQLFAKSGIQVEMDHGSRGDLMYTMLGPDRHNVSVYIGAKSQ
jgi:hypothetical protein